ncbi:ABC transporter permease [Bifidobacterium pseudolongum]|jgi:oligopeptide transport system permease protein|uniref:ABC transporter permease n=1 Tax=Bifidobacterium pseudolongum TaxID=1694 RepID=A0A4S4FBM3_9BIFI|nr:ABC transporter permease [Bifidobacterium pseudolongum]MCI1194416.1 ABC transporter permease [Bifidobacterium pseudolongum subsp. globosum]MCI8753808.1 ABC transporter permease [Bifidobacterium pseudolongum]THG26922.1 ABC transporter permease [Bifidobacterium pseudolongum]UNP92594.1 ABC transporter permease [Bifidobacterium pseudolongum subsp. globosum]UNZ09200.1 ABC transporter permease [Bifidobacterium pseudolongum subsp. globosum]
MTDINTTLPGQERYVAPLKETPLQTVDTVDESAPATSMWSDAWRTLRRNPLFIISAILIVFIIFVALFPGVFTKTDPNYCTLDDSLEPARPGHPFGFDMQGCDVYARVVYGTRTSLSVGILSTLIVVAVGTLIGAIAGFCGGWIDAVLSRIVDIFMAIPMLLGAIVVLQMFRTVTSIWKVVLVLALFGWVSTARIARGAVLSSKNLEFNTASTALGSTPMRNLFRHILPNSLAPIIVIATTSLGSYIVSEATLSFLGIGLPSTTVSWGGDISNAQSILRTDPMVLFYPSVALAVTVLAFIMMGDAVKDALDPKSRTA